MATWNDKIEDLFSRIITPILGNTVKDGSGTFYFPVVDSDGHTQVDVLSGATALTTGTSRIGIMLEDPFEVRVAVAIDGSDSASFSANDVLGNDDCCSTDATYWTFNNMANSNGGYGVIDYATIFSESEDIEPRLTMMLFNAPPTGELRSNWPNTNPLPTDRTKYVGEVAWAALDKVSSSVASVQVASSSTVGKLPLFYKCAAGSTTLYGILKTLDDFTQTDTDDIEVSFQIKHL